MGKWIVFEGSEGSGKSTTIAALGAYLEQKNMQVEVTREPGGTALAESLRALLLNPGQEEIMPITELLMIFAGRTQHLHHKILPNLQKGKWVLCDRFIDATFAYQGGGRGLPDHQIETLAQWVVGSRKPDCIFLLDCPAELGLARVRARYKITPGAQLDRIEQEQLSFFQKVREKYLERAQKEPDRYELISSALPFSEVLNQVCAALYRRGWL